MREPGILSGNVIPRFGPAVALVSATWDIEPIFMRKTVGFEEGSHSTDTNLDKQYCDTDDCCSFATHLPAAAAMEFW